MTNEYALSAARMMVRKSHAEIGLIADRLFNERTMGQDVRHQLGRRLNAINVSLNTALMLLDQEDVKLSVWVVTTVSIRGEYVYSDDVYLDKDEAQKRVDEVNSRYGKYDSRRVFAKQLAVQREWREVADAKETSRV